MSTFSLLALTLSLLLIFTTATSSSSSSSDDLVNDLLTLQSNSKTGIIHLNDQLISRFLTSSKTPRAYTLLIFFDAVQLHDKSELRLRDLHKEFSILATSFITNNADKPSSDKIFFCDLEFKESQSSFGLFGVNALPHIRLIEPNVSNLKDSDKMDQGDLSRLADSMAEYVESKTKLTVGPIIRPPMFSRNQISLMVVFVLIWTPFVVKKILTGQTLLHDPKLWLSGSVFIYFFSVSGAMHNIIRKMPMFISDRNDPSKLVFFYQGSGMQLGAEGFAVGFLYTIVGLLMAFVTNVLVKVKNVNVQRFIMIFVMFVAFWAVKKVIYLDNWKTGYGIHGYWPSSW
ncbi:hypothetical protein ACFE04_001868 [Oxalis oulophora]